MTTRKQIRTALSEAARSAKAADRELCGSRSRDRQEASRQALIRARYCEASASEAIALIVQLRRDDEEAAS